MFVGPGSSPGHADEMVDNSNRTQPALESRRQDAAASRRQQSPGFWPVGAELQSAGLPAPGILVSPDPIFPELGIVVESITPIGPVAMVRLLAPFPSKPLPWDESGYPTILERLGPAPRPVSFTDAQPQTLKGNTARRMTAAAISLRDFIANPQIASHPDGFIRMSAA